MGETKIKRQINRGGGGVQPRAHQSWARLGEGASAISRITAATAATLGGGERAGEAGRHRPQEGSPDGQGSSRFSVGTTKRGLGQGSGSPSPGSQLFCHGLDCNSCLLCHGRQHRDLRAQRGESEGSSGQRRRGCSWARGGGQRTRISSPQSYFCSISLPRSPSGRRRSSRTSPLSWSSDRYPSWMPISCGQRGKEAPGWPTKVEDKGPEDKQGRPTPRCPAPPLPA